MRNHQIDLDNHLFAELERLGNEELGADELRAEIERAEAITKVANAINSSRANSLKALRFKDEAQASHPTLPEGF